MGCGGHTPRRYAPSPDAAPLLRALGVASTRGRATHSRRQRAGLAVVVVCPPAAPFAPPPTQASLHSVLQSTSAPTLASRLSDEALPFAHDEHEAAELAAAESFASLAPWGRALHQLSGGRAPPQLSRGTLLPDGLLCADAFNTATRGMLRPARMVGILCTWETLWGWAEHEGAWTCRCAREGCARGGLGSFCGAPTCANRPHAWTCARERSCAGQKKLEYAAAGSNCPRAPREAPAAAPDRCLLRLCCPQQVYDSMTELGGELKRERERRGSGTGPD